MTFGNTTRIHALCKWGMLLLGISLRMYWWVEKGFWEDSFALEAGLRTCGFGDLLSGKLGFGQTAPIGFSFLGKTLGELSGWNERVLTFPLLFAGIATLFLLDMVLDTMKVVRGKLLFLLLFALHPSLVLYSSEFKPYGFDVLFATLFLLLSRTEAIRRKNRCLSLAFFVAPLFSTTSFFVIPAVCLVLFLEQFRRSNPSSPFSSRFRTAVLPLTMPLFVAIATGIVALNVLIAGMPIRHMEGYWGADFAPFSVTAESIGWYWNRLLGFFQSPLHFPGSPRFPVVLRIASFLAGVMLFALGARQDGRRWNNSAVFSLLICGFVFVASSLRKWPIRTGDTLDSRLLLALVPSFSCTMALGVETLFDRNRFWAIVLFPVCIIGNCLQLGHLRFPRFMYSADSLRRTVRAVSELDRVDAILVDGPSLSAFWATNPDWTSIASQETQFRSAELRVNDGTPFVESVQNILDEFSIRRYSSAFVIYTIRHSTTEAETVVLRNIMMSGIHYTATTNDSVVLIELNAK